MISIIYTTSEVNPRNGPCERTVTAYRIKKNVPEFIGTRTDTYCGNEQILMNLLEAKKALPKKAFTRHESGGYKYGILGLEQYKIATITSV